MTTERQPWPHLAAHLSDLAKSARGSLSVITGQLTGPGGSRLRDEQDLRSTERRLIAAQRDIGDALNIVRCMLHPDYDIDAYERRLKGNL